MLANAMLLIAENAYLTPTFQANAQAGKSPDSELGHVFYNEVTYSLPKSKLKRCNMIFRNTVVLHMFSVMEKIDFTILGHCKTVPTLILLFTISLILIESAALAQMVACLPLVQQVRGSIPGGVVNFNLKILNFGARRGGDVQLLISKL